MRTFPILISPELNKLTTRHVITKECEKFLVAGNIHCKKEVNHGEISDHAVLILQLILSYVLKIKPLEIRCQLLRIICQEPTCTWTQLENKVLRDRHWIAKMLKITKYYPDVCVSNTYALMRLPECEREGFLNQAIIMRPAEFMPIVLKRVNEIRKAQQKVCS